MAGGDRRQVKQFLLIISSRRATPFLVIPPILAYIINLVGTGSQTVMLSQGIDVLTGGVDLPHLMSNNAWVAAYAAVLLAHVLARLVRTSIADAQTPNAEVVDAEHILARSSAYTVVAPAEDWVTRASQAIPNSWYVTNEQESKAIFWSGPRLWLRRLWRYAGWLLLFGLFVSVLTRVALYVRVGDGQALQAPVITQVYRYDWRFPVTGVTPQLDAGVIGVVDGTVNPSISEAGTFVPRGYLSRPVVADVVLGKSSYDAKQVPMWIPTLFGGRFVTLVDMGLAPHVVVTKDGAVVLDTYGKIEIAPGMGDRDVMELEGLPFALDLTLKPGINPVPYAEFTARAVRGASVVASGTISPVSQLEAQGYSIAISENRWWVGVSIVRDPGLWIFIVGSILLAVALLIRLWVFAKGSQRYEMIVASTEQGPRLYIGAEASWSARRKAERRLRSVASAVSRKDD